MPALRTLVPSRLKHLGQDGLRGFLKCPLLAGPGMSCCVAWLAMGDPSEARSAAREEDTPVQVMLGAPWRPGSGDLLQVRPRGPRSWDSRAPLPNVLCSCRESLLRPRCPWLGLVFLSCSVNVLWMARVGGGHPARGQTGGRSGTPWLQLGKPATAHTAPRRLGGPSAGWL